MKSRPQWGPREYAFQPQYSQDFKTDNVIKIFRLLTCFCSSWRCSCTGTSSLQHDRTAYNQTPKRACSLFIQLVFPLHACTQTHTEFKCTSQTLCPKLVWTSEFRRETLQPLRSVKERRVYLHVPSASTHHLCHHQVRKKCSTFPRQS